MKTYRLLFFRLTLVFMFINYIIREQITLIFLLSFMPNGFKKMVRLTVISLIFLLSFSHSSVTGQNPESEIEKNLRLVDANIRLGGFSKALLLIEDILVMQPNNLDAQEKKINILVQQDRSREAFADIEEYISMYPNNPEYYYLRAVLNLQKQKYTKAIDDFNNAIRLDMPAATIYKVYLNRGMAHFYNQDFDLALNDFDEVLALNPRSAAAYHGKGMIKYELDEYEDAVTEFQQSLKLDDTNPITYYNLAMTYYRMNENDNACYYFNKSCEMGHRNACRLLMMQCNINIPK